jgi:excisionase family DNA binding protein
MRNSKSRSDVAIAAARAIALPDVCCVEDVAAHLRVETSTVRRWLRNGTLQGCRVGRRWYMTRESVLARFGAILPVASQPNFKKYDRRYGDKRPTRPVSSTITARPARNLDDGSATTTYDSKITFAPPYSARAGIVDTGFVDAEGR